MAGTVSVRHGVIRMKSLIRIEEIAPEIDSKTQLLEDAGETVTEDAVARLLTGIDNPHPWTIKNSRSTESLLINDLQKSYSTALKLK